MMPTTIRPIAIAIIWNRGKILVAESYDPIKDQYFCRPLGGGIEFGETSTQAIVREIREEIDAELKQLRLLGTLENIFSYLGKPGHEIVQVYSAEFTHSSLYEQVQIKGIESDGTAFVAVWRALNAFSSTLPLFPTGLLKLLQANLPSDMRDS